MGILERNAVTVRGRAGGSPMVFAHGFGCDQNMWRLVAPAFEADRLTATFDHIGFGHSDIAAFDSSRHDSLQGYADDLIEVCEALETEPVVFVGHSVAAMIGIRAAIVRPDLFAELVLVGPSPRYIDDDTYTGGFSAADIDGLLDSLDRNYLGWSSAMAPVIMGNSERPELGQELTEAFCRAEPKIASQFARVTFLSDSRADLAKVTTPSLILQCSDDPIAPLAVGQYTHEHLADSSLVVLEATGHCPNLSAPEETIAAITSYLDG